MCGKLGRVLPASAAGQAGAALGAAGQLRNGGKKLLNDSLRADATRSLISINKQNKLLLLRSETDQHSFGSFDEHHLRYVEPRKER